MKAPIRENSHSAPSIHTKTLHNAVAELEKEDEEEEEEIERTVTSATSNQHQQLVNTASTETRARKLRGRLEKHARILAETSSQLHLLENYFVYLDITMFQVMTLVCFATMMVHYSILVLS